MPVDYSKGKIYKIVSNINDDIYIGSTCDTINRRLANHVRAHKSYLKGQLKRGCSSFKIIETDDFKIILLEDYPCETKKHLEQRERYWIENTICVNKVVPTRTTKERNAITGYDKKWRDANKDKCIKYREKRKEKQKTNKIVKEKPSKKTHEQIAEYKAKWFQENKERLQEANKLWAKEHPEKNKQFKRNWYEKNKDEIKANYENVKDAKNARRRELYKQKKEMSS